MSGGVIRDIPEDVLKELKQRAKFHNRPLQRELLVILEETARQPYENITQRAAEIRMALAGKCRTFTDSAELQREDRDR